MEDEFELCSLYSDEGKIMVPQVTFDLNQLQMLLAYFVRIISRADEKK